jgi:SecA DEAD-like domain
LYTKKVLDGVTAFKSRDHSLRVFLSEIVTDARKAVEEDSLGHSEQVILLTSILFAHWSLSNLSDLVLGESESSTLSKYVMKPHAAQVVACWIMLNVHNADDFHVLQHHLTQLGTGEGKSIVLGVLATMLALWGYTVDVVCYSSYLSNRDLKAFRDMFAGFKVDRWIWYGTLKGLSEKILGSDFRSLAEAAFRGDATPNECEGAYRPTVLLVDEVDVFFGDDVFGSQFCPVCCFEAEALVNLFKTIWAKSAGGGAPQCITTDPDVEQCLRELPPAVHSQFNRSIRHMQHDASYIRNGSSRQYYVVGDKIGYKYFDGLTTSFFYGFETHFLYVKEWENGILSQESMESKLSLNCCVATTSYAEFPFAYDVILGITGTLSSLRPDERNVLEDMYGIRAYSYMPSVFGRNRLVFAGNDERGTNSAFYSFQSSFAIKLHTFFSRCLDFKLCDTRSDHIFELKQELLRRRLPTVETQKVHRPVMIFFDCQDALFAFHDSTLMESLKKEVAVVTEATPTYEKDSLFLKATEAGAITLLIRDFGRGTDFKCFDRRVLNAGGVHVIQAFFSKDVSEEIQIMGRCARQGTDGSFRYEQNRSGFVVVVHTTHSLVRQYDPQRRRPPA